MLVDEHASVNAFLESAHLNVLYRPFWKQKERKCVYCAKVVPHLNVFERRNEWLPRLKINE